MSKVAEYLSGERLDDVALYLTHEYLDSQGKLPNMGEEVENGYILIVPGDDGRRAFAAGTGMDAMEFAQTAMGNDGDIDRDLSGGVCPDATSDENHEAKFIFSFAEAQNEEVGGIYEEGDVIHAYAKCTCGTTYSDRWVVDDE
ncbi:MULTISPECIES: DUF5807 family protein [Haloferax]|uniref:Uncharacterized protein n=2 Tax=Haloferax TaxID=2251 RepID=A0A6G1YZT2_9EURY|nr:MULTISPECIES: DUF5807 family protein [Haloferax]KAB1187263.1 hypothetical protein Hfx1149_04165 [Haloferax sp. CBA1149]MRW79907.1 hypothetical protein [Haloferax marinisediminis]